MKNPEIINALLSDGDLKERKKKEKKIEQNYFCVCTGSMLPSTSSSE